MRAEDVKSGMWLRTNGHVLKTLREINPQLLELQLVDGRIQQATRALVEELSEPWTPRVGERIRHKASRAELVVGYVTENDDGGVITADGYMLRFHEIDPCAPPEAKPVTSLDDEAARDTYLAERQRQRAEVRASWPKVEPERDHNATCARCGGKAYLGIGSVRCVEPVCDDPRTRMPEHVRRVTRRGERVWSAEGRGVLASHPLKEGAILAWREAVNRG